jgi:hypothetical protein
MFGFQIHQYLLFQTTEEVMQNISYELLVTLIDYAWKHLHTFHFVKHLIKIARPSELRVT